MTGKNFVVTKNFTEDYDGTKVLVIYIEHVKKHERYKDRFLLFNEDTATYRSHVEQLQKRKALG